MNNGLYAIGGNILYEKELKIVGYYTKKIPAAVFDCTGMLKSMYCLMSKLISGGYCTHYILPF